MLWLVPLSPKQKEKALSSPIEFRHYLRTFTLEDVRENLQPIRARDGRLYAPPALQWRYRLARIGPDGGTTMQWSDWQDVPYVCEGDEAFHVGQIPVTAETIAQ